MSDVQDVQKKEKKDLEKMTRTPFFIFAKPYADFIGQGKLFELVYIVMAVISLLIPFYVFYKAVDEEIFDYGGKVAVTFIFSWLVVAFACWIGFQLWWDRKSKVKTFEEAEFIATPMLSQIVQTFGEWLGTLLGIIGAGVGIIAALALGDEASELFSMMGMDFLGIGAMVILAGPLAGFFCIIVFRFFAELMRIAAALANNTKEIAAHLKK